ncbi:MAG: hypothetical protein IKL16_04695 [Clostridia bacterium]|nr:hypothetical protein [Clostridia bacterium]
METNPVYFYVNSIGPDGFFSVCKECMDENSATRVYLIRGGVSESGKFIEEVASSLEKEGLFSQHFLSFYGDETDGVYFPDIDVYIFDENKIFFQPSMIDCKHYTVDLGVCGDRKMLYRNSYIISDAKEREKKFLSKAVKFFSAAQSAGEDIERLSGDAVNAEKIERFVSRFIKRELGTVSTFSGKEYLRILTSPMPMGMIFPENTLTKMCPKLYCIDDRTGTVSKLLISQIKESAMLCGFDVISLLSPFSQKAEHLIVPEIGLGIITSDDLHHFEGDCFRRVSYTRFAESEKMKKHRSRIKFNVTARKELMTQGYFLLGEAKKCREEYLEVYSRSYNRDKIKSLADDTTREIISFVNCT